MLRNQAPIAFLIKKPTIFVFEVSLRSYEIVAVILIPSSADAFALKAACLIDKPIHAKTAMTV